ncbi:MAG TPA: hypothetical protein VFM18_18015 [Methanosarcina sp.]|nr:hypothetical protein [Methanosarcina sp.]
MFRTYSVWISKNGLGELICYSVSDAQNQSEVNNRPAVVEFPISQAYPKDMQKERAHDYCDYLNKLAKAAKEAYENNRLVDVLKTP